MDHPNYPKGKLTVRVHSDSQREDLPTHGFNCPCSACARSRGEVQGQGAAVGVVIGIALAAIGAMIIALVVALNAPGH